VSEAADEIGPIDYLIIEFPRPKFTGEGLTQLVDLVDRGIIRLLDLVVVVKEEDGSIAGLAVSDFDGDGELDLAVFEGVRSGLIGSAEIDEAGSILNPGSAAAVLMYENVWAAPMAAAIRRAGGQLVASGRIPTQEIIATLEALDS
jgi:hypothetical protein